MKKIFTIAAIAVATVLSASCAKEIEGEFQKEGIVAHASLQPVEATKAIGQYSYNIVWEENDKIAVLDKDNNKASFKLTDGASTTSGTFQQEGADALTAPLTAYYPSSVVAEDKSLVWPATQADVKNISNVPMMASSPTATGDVTFAFKHLGSVLQLVLTAKNGTINVKQIDITADQGLSGAFTVENGAAVISNTGTTITSGDISAKNIKLTATASYSNFAVPAGDFTNFRIIITDINGKTYSLSAASLTLNRAMVNKVTFALDAKDPAIFEVNVNGHTVRVKLAEVSGIEKDIMVTAYAEGTSVVIKAQAESGRPVECVISDDKLCDFTKNNNIYTFTISDITSDLTATVGYVVAHSVSLNKDALNLIKEYGHYRLVATVLPEEAEDKSLTWTSSDESVATVDQNGYVKALATGSATITVETKVGGYKATSTVTVAEPQSRPDGTLPGHFSVSDSTVVFFSKGNLYCSGATFNNDGTVKSMLGATWGFETHQYDTTPSVEDNRNNDHLSHFMWCNSAKNAMALNYDSRWNGQSSFFAEKDFSVGGVNIWSTPTTDEWKYLLNTRTMKNDVPRYTNIISGITIEGKNYIGLFIYPDDYDGMVVGEASETWTWENINAAGIVFLPAAGRRSGGSGVTRVSGIGYGFYWLASSSGNGSAFGLFLGDSYVISDDFISPRSEAYSVRLVTDVK